MSTRVARQPAGVSEAASATRIPGAWLVRHQGNRDCSSAPSGCNHAKPLIGELRNRSRP